MQFAHRRKKKLPVFKASKKVVSQLNFGWQIYLWGAFFILIFAGLLYLIFWSPYLKVKSISVESGSLNKSEEIKAAVVSLLSKKYKKFIPGDAFFMVFSGAIKESIEKSFPEAKDVVVKKDILKGLEISLTGRQAAAILCKGEKEAAAEDKELLNQENATTTLVGVGKKLEVIPKSQGCFFVDSGGFLFRHAPEISGTLLPTLYDLSGGDLFLGSFGIASSTINFINLTRISMKEQEIDFKGFLINADNSPDLVALSQEGWNLYFDLNRSAEAPIKILEALLRADLKENRETLKYIDLRTVNRVYYK
jgi:hypothetical protein